MGTNGFEARSEKSNAAFPREELSRRRPQGGETRRNGDERTRKTPI